MSKKYKGKTCVYCAENLSVTGEHIFAKAFFLESERANLPQAPTCENCNNQKSKLEHYLTTILLFGSMHDHAEENLKTLVPKRLEQNRKLTLQLVEGMQYMQWDSKQNLVLPFNSDALTRLFEYIAKGLAWYHWDSIISKSSFVLARTLTSSNESYFDRFLSLFRSDRNVNNQLGQNSFSYKGIQAVDTEQITIWKFYIYNGLTLLDEQPVCYQCVGVVTGPLSMKKTLASIFDTRRAL